MAIRHKCRKCSRAVDVISSRGLCIDCNNAVTMRPVILDRRHDCILSEFMEKRGEDTVKCGVSGCDSKCTYREAYDSGWHYAGFNDILICSKCARSNHIIVEF